MSELPRGASDSLPPTGAQPPEAAADGGRSAGAILRAARERQDLHLDVLAATIKVSAAKLQALEEGRYDQLPNATFVRALAQSVCRSLKIDPRPVLALLPLAEAPPLEGSVGKLNTPFREPSGRGDAKISALSAKPLFWAAGVLLAAAVAVYLLPPSLWTRATFGALGPAQPAATSVTASPVPLPEAAPAASAPAAEAVAASAPTLAPQLDVAASPASAAAPVPVLEPAPSLVPGSLQIATTAVSWIEIHDANGVVVLSRTFQPGESLGLDAPLPLKVKVGNAAGTRLSLRGQPVDLAASTRDNVARLALR